MLPRPTLLAFDSFLAARGLSLEAIVIGGAALNLLGLVERPTKDCDVLAPPLTDAQRTAIRDFARQRSQAGDLLADDWINNGPASLVRDLPLGWEQRLQVVLEGEALLLRTLGRVDLIRSKLFALCDRGLDLADCVALAPTADELSAIHEWLCERDGHPQWPEHVRRVVADLSRRLGHGL